jgi:hypothetical protein
MHIKQKVDGGPGAMPRHPWPVNLVQVDPVRVHPAVHLGGQDHIGTLPSDQGFAHDLL